MMSLMKELFDLEKHYAIYGSHHRNPINVFIHMIFIWPIFFTTTLFLYFMPSLFDLPLIGVSIFGNHFFLVMNLGFLLTVICAVFYVCLEPKAGFLAALLCFVCWVSSSFLASFLGFFLVLKVFLIAQIVCWTGLLIGHRVFEKKAPALLDNFEQALIMAPFFVLLEALHSFFHYEPYPGFHARVQAKIFVEINQIKKSTRSFM